MIVDDDPQLCAALQFKFERAGYQVWAVSNGQEDGLGGWRTQGEGKFHLLEFERIE